MKNSENNKMFYKYIHNIIKNNEFLYEMKNLKKKIEINKSKQL